MISVVDVGREGIHNGGKDAVKVSKNKFGGAVAGRTHKHTIIYIHASFSHLNRKYASTYIPLIEIIYLYFLTLSVKCIQFLKISKMTCKTQIPQENDCNIT